MPLRPVRSHRSTAAPITSHAPRNSPTGPSMLRPVCFTQTSPASASASTNTGAISHTARPSLARFHGITAPTGSTSPSSTMKGVKAMLKNGGPTLSLRSRNISATSGHMVPTKTTKHATANRMLLTSSALSRLTMPKTPRASMAPARRA